MTPRLASPTLSLQPTAAQRRGQGRAWLGPLCVAASLVAHGVVLALAVPTPQGDRPTADVVEEPAVLEDIAVTVLPKSVTAEAPPAANLSQPPAPSAVVPRVEPAPRPSAPQAIPPQPIASQPIAPTDPPPTSPAETSPEPAAFTPPPPPPAAEPEPPAPYASFPHLAGAQAACEGLADCWRSPVSSSWRGAASDLKARLEAQGYTLNNVTGDVLSIDSGVRIYAVSKPGEASYYLNLVSVSEGVLYTMTTEPMTSDQVLTLQRS